MADTETVTLRLPSGEEIDAVVPAGMSDAEIRVFTMAKRPDLFEKLRKSPGQPLAAMSGAAQPSPQMQGSGLANAFFSVPNAMMTDEPYSSATGVNLQKGQPVLPLSGQQGEDLTQNVSDQFAKSGQMMMGVGSGLAGAKGLANAALPPLTAGVKAIGVWAKANPEMAYALHWVLGNAIKGAIGGAAFGAAHKFVKGFPTPGE
jgi:hypothetical protein